MAKVLSAKIQKPGFLKKPGFLIQFSARHSQKRQPIAFWSDRSYSRSPNLDFRF
ncbi:MAG: hypothetical protein SXA11_14430 [Cyanobacteriota bacterium]|nr:hypothetical protein [Cyanobacteriota bacterium]